jgi:cytochrome c oxidase subunit I+III
MSDTATPAYREAPSADHEQLDRTWSSPKGFIGWFMPVNHTVIGRRFIVTAFVFFLLGGIEALMMRAQLARPESGLIDPDTYSMLFTMHGITMMFFFAVPMLEGIGIYMVPKMIGTRDMAFPRLNAFGYYVYLIAGIVLYAGLLMGQAPDAGWFNYVPLASEEFSPGMRIDLYTTMITFIEVAALVAAVELIVTILKQRAPGMSLNRMPVFVWSMLVTSLMIVFAMPAVMVASIQLALDRTVGTHFFNVSQGGEPLLWQHLFWFFGHPEVYIILIPALGFVSSIVVTFSRRPLFGYPAVVFSMVSIGLLSFGLWVHHMYTTGIPELGASFFTAASVMVAIPSGVQIFCWIATLWGGKPVVRTPLLFVIGFVVIFVIGGISGVMVAAVPFDEQVHDTYFVVAHFHYVLIGGMVFPLFGAFYYWFPKVMGRMLSERLGRWNFWLFFVGFNVAFFPQHNLGFMGMPRRVYTYLDGMGWGTLNMVSTIGAFTVAASVAVFLVNVARAMSRPADAPDDPWGADTLEWALHSPPPVYNFHHIPVVEGRWGLWEREPGAPIPVVVGERDDRREVLVTTVIEARPQKIAVLPGPSIWPFLTAVSTAIAFLGVMWSTWWVPVGGMLTFVCIVAWQWPRREERTPPWKGGAR